MLDKTEDLEGSISTKVKTRGALKGSDTKLCNRIKEKLNDEFMPVDKFWF